MSTKIKDEGLTAIKVGFNQQQRQLIEKLKLEDAYANSEVGQIVRDGFLQWLTKEGWLPSKSSQGQENDRG